MSWVGPAISAVGSVVGGLLGKSGAEKSNDQNTALQREFAQQGVRWRVEDAKAAGLHPLYALQGSGATFTPSAQNVMAPLGAALGDMGQNVGRAIQAQETEQERETRQAQLELLKSQIRQNDAQTAAINSEQQRAWLTQWTARPPNLDGMGLKADPFWALSADARVSRGAGGQGLPGVVAGKVTTKADEVVSPRAGDPSVTAGQHSAMREYVIGPSGLKMRLPYSEEGPSEVLENVPLWAWPALIQHNRAYYGEDWGTRFMKEFVFGKPPVYRQMPSRGSFKYKGGFGRGPGRSQ